jgi:hypothetical protein
VKRHIGPRALENIPDHHDPAGVGIGKRFKENWAYDAKDGRVCANPQGQRQHGNGCEPWRFREHPNGEAQILQ